MTGPGISCRPTQTGEKKLVPVAHISTIVLLEFRKRSHEVFFKTSHDSDYALIIIRNHQSCAGGLQGDFEPTKEKKQKNSHKFISIDALKQT